MTDIKAIFFDLDNTLYDFKSAWEKAHQLLFDELNLYKYFKYADFMEVYRTEDERLWKLLLKNEITLDELRAIRPCSTFSYFEKELSYEDGENFYKRMFELLVSQIKADVRIHQLLDDLSNKYILYLLTNGISTEQREKIEQLNFKKYFRNIYISEEVGVEKPNLEFFKYVLQKEELASKNCMMIGDSFRNDIVPAKKLNMKTMHIQYNELASTPKLKFEV